MLNRIETQQRQENERLVERINAFWSQRGIIANARVEHKTVPVGFKYVEHTRLELDKPDLVPSWEIVSELGVMAAAWFRWSGKKRRRAA